MSIDWNWVLIVGGAIVVLIEVLLGGFAGFDLVLTGSCLVLGGAIGLALGNPVAGVAIASALSVAYIAAGRRWVRDRMKARAVPSNVDAVVGRTALVTVRVAAHQPGQVRVHDEIWRAVPAPGTTGPFEPGTEVTVQGVEGVTLQVR